MQRADIEDRWLKVVTSLDATDSESVPSDSALASLVGNSAGLRHEFDVQWNYTRFVRDRVPGGTFVDVGCGAGELSLLLGLMGAEKIVAIDCQGRCIDFARRLLSGVAGLGNVEFLQEDAALAELPGSSIDGVFSIEAISHYRDPYAFLDAAADWLRPNGFLFVSDGNNGASRSVRAKNQEIWDAFEDDPAPGAVHGHSKSVGCYRERRAELIRSAYPLLEQGKVARFADWTFGYSASEVIDAVRRFERNDLSARSERGVGMCPKDPDTDCMMEQLFDPRGLAREARARGLACRVISNGPARRDMAWARWPWEAASPLTIHSRRGYSLVCTKEGF